MSTSGTYTFSVTRDDISTAALRLLEVYGAGVTPPADDLTNCAQALNILVKEMVTSGMPLWCVAELTIPMVAGQTVYDVGAASSQPRPLRVLQAFIRDADDNDTILTVESRFDYNTQGNKTSPGVPNQLYYNPALDTGTITVYNVPDTAGSVIHLTVQRQIQDFAAPGNTPDLPQEAYRMLKWCLADEIGLEYGASGNKATLIALKAAQLRKDFMDFQQEQVSVFFTPSERRY